MSGRGRCKAVTASVPAGIFIRRSAALELVGVLDRRIIGHLVQAFVPVVAWGAREQVLPAPATDRLRTDAEPFRHFVAGQQAAFAQPPVSRLQAMGVAHLLHPPRVEGLAVSGPQAPTVEDPCNLLLAMIVEQCIDRLHDLGRRGVELEVRQVKRNGELPRGAAAKPDAEFDLLAAGDGDILDHQVCCLSHYVSRQRGNIPTLTRPSVPHSSFPRRCSRTA